MLSIAWPTLNFLWNQDEFWTAEVANVFAEVIGHGADIVAYKYPSLFGGDRQDSVIPETFKWNFSRPLEV